MGLAMRCASISAAQRPCQSPSSFLGIFASPEVRTAAEAIPTGGIREAPRMRTTLRIPGWRTKTRRRALSNAHLDATQPSGYPHSSKPGKRIPSGKVIAGCASEGRPRRRRTRSVATGSGPPAQCTCKGSELSRALAPFHRICTPMHTSRNDVSCRMTVIPVLPRICPSRSAKP